jgi:choice-of-anchor C domain-containing protein
MKKIIILVVLILALSASMAMANGVVAFRNGSFENATTGQAYIDNGSGFETLYADSTAIDGWTVTAGSIDWIGNYWQRADGLSKSLDMNGSGSAGTISQTFLVIPNTTYLVTFAMAGNPDHDPAVKAMIGAASSTSETFYFTTVLGASTRSNMNWKPMSFTFKTGSLNETTLSFQSDMPDSSWGPALDNVSVKAVPETSTFVGFGSALAMAAPGMIGWFRRRRA